jgi:hypothetical protein
MVIPTLADVYCLNSPRQRLASFSQLLHPTLILINQVKSRKLHSTLRESLLRNLLKIFVCALAWSPSVVVAQDLDTWQANAVPGNFSGSIRARCYTTADPNPEVKYYYKLDQDYLITFFAVLAVNAKFRHFELPLMNFRSPFSQGDDMEIGQNQPLYWSNTLTRNTNAMWELRSCGNVVHHVFDAVASLNTITNELSVSQSTIRSRFNTCERSYRHDRSEIKTIFGEFKCEIIDR